MFGREQVHCHLMEGHHKVPLLPKCCCVKTVGLAGGKPACGHAGAGSSAHGAAHLRPWPPGRLPPLAVSRFFAGKQRFRRLRSYYLLRDDRGRLEAARDTSDALRLMNPDPQTRFATRDGTEDSEVKGRESRPLSPKSAKSITPRAGEPPGAGRLNIRLRLPFSGRESP